MQELVKIDIKPPVVDINYETAKRELGNWLKPYKNVVLTEDQVSKGRELATEINQSRLSMNKQLKEKINLAAKPITEAKEKVKILDGMHEDTRQAILAQVALHDQKKLDLARKLLTDLRQSLWQEHEVVPEFHRAEFDDQIKISSVTESGNLTKAAKDQLTARVRDDRALQDKTHMRLLELENRCHRAGLGAPLKQEHVASFLYADDPTYERELQKLLDSEVSREQEAKAKWERDREQEADRKAAVEKEEADRKARQAPPEPAPAAEPAPEPATPAAPEPAQPDANGLQPVRVLAHFCTKIHPKVTDEAIESELRKRLADAGITSLDKIDIFRGKINV